MTCLLCLLLLVTFPSVSQQFNFNKIEQDNSYQFNYQWRDQSGAKQAISFVLTKEALFKKFRNFRAYRPQFAEAYTAQKIKKTLQEKPIENVQVNFVKKSGKISLDINSRDQAALSKAYAQISELQQKYGLEYLKENYYQRFTTHDSIQGIKPNHRAIAQSSVADLKPLRDPILNTVSIKNIRKVTDYTLGFVQSIPYSRLESRVTSLGAGFSTPLKVLWENQGDCDSKVTLTGAILRALMPRVKIIFVFIDQHALIGIDVPARAGETSIEYQGSNYLLAEPTGPAKLLLGKIAPDSELAINNNLYSVEKFF